MSKEQTKHEEEVKKLMDCIAGMQQQHNDTSRILWDRLTNLFNKYSDLFIKHQNVCLELEQLKKAVEITYNRKQMSNFICKKCNKEGIKAKNRLECIDCRAKFLSAYKKQWFNKDYKAKQFDYSQRTRKKAREQLEDSYIIHSLRVNGFKNITKEIIEIQRLILKNKRLCKTLQT